MSATRRRRRSGGGLAFSPFARSNDDLLLDYDLQEQTGLVAHAWNRAVDLGRDIVINGDFATDTIWTKQAGWTIAGGKATNDGSENNITQDIGLKAGKTYFYSFDIVDVVSGAVRMLASDDGSGFKGAVDTYTGTLSIGADGILLFDSSSFVGSIDNVIIQQTNILASSVYPGSELYVTANAASDPAGNEADATTGWTSAASTLTSDSSVKAVGDYSLKTVFTLNSGYIAFDLDTILSVGERATITFDARHLGTGGRIDITLAAGLAGLDFTIVFLESTDTTFESYEVTFTHSAATRYLGARERNATDDGGVYIDNISIKVKNPLDADITAATLGVPTGLPLGYAMTFDGATTYISLLNALTELNSIINMQKGSIVAYINPTALGSDKVIFTIYVDANNWIKAHTEAAGTVTVEYRGAGTTSTASITGVVTGAWQQIALTWDTTADGGNGEFIGYLNESQSDTTQVIADEIVGNLTKAIMFADTDTPTLVFNGSGSQTIKLYVAAQSPSQVAELSRRAGTS